MRASLWCKHAEAILNSTVTKEAFQQMLDQLYEQAEAEGRHNRPNNMPAPPAVVSTCRFIDTRSGEIIRFNQTDYKPWTSTADQWRAQYKGVYLCTTHNQEPQMFFTYAAYEKRWNEKIRAKFEHATLTPRALDNPEARRANPYWYRWSMNGYWPKRPKPRVLHDIFATEAGMTPARG